MDATDLAARIDHTLLAPEALPADVERACAEAREHRFASVCVQPVYVPLVKRALGGSGVKTCAVTGFPHGANRATVKAIEAASAVKDGADEVDVVAHLPHLLARDVDAARREIAEIVRAARATGREVTVKVIVESAALVRNAADPEAVVADACRAVREGGADFIKTSTGFHPAGGASADVVRWMAKHAGGLRVKASGGIRDLATARAMLDAGADRLGMSAGVAVVRELAGGAAGRGDGY